MIRKRYRIFEMEQTTSKNRNQLRLKRHRSTAAAKGSKRVEVTVPVRDASLIKAIALALRTGGEDAKRIRDSLEPIVSSRKARTGSELIEFLRKSPLVGSDLEIERDASTGRSADLI